MCHRRGAGFIPVSSSKIAWLFAVTILACAWTPALAETGVPVACDPYKDYSCLDAGIVGRIHGHYGETPLARRVGPC